MTSLELRQLLTLLIAGWRADAEVCERRAREGGKEASYYDGKARTYHECAEELGKALRRG